MRRLIGAVVLAVFALLSAVDTVCCPDGCTTEIQSAGDTEHAPDEECSVLCTSGVTAATPVAVGPALGGSDAADSLGAVSPDDANSDPADHPPRS